MGKTRTAKVLDEVREQVAPSDEILKGVRARRSDVLEVASGFPGVRDEYTAGSVAHGTANDDLDADVGVVLDRRSHPDLGPDGDDEGPNDVVEEMRRHLRDGLKESYPDVTFRVTKRAIVVTFHEELDEEGHDPSVDLIVALERANSKPGLWIPNTEKSAWDASHPQEHTRLLARDGVKEHRVLRARVIRLAKAWNSCYAQKALSSFNLEALALLSITAEMDDLGVALYEFFLFSAADQEKRLTPDPADVSPPIKRLLDKDTAVGRLKKARDRLKEALAAEADDDEDALRDALSDVFPELVAPPEGGGSKAAFAAAATADRVGFEKGRLTTDGTGRPVRGRGYGGAQER